MQNRKAQYEAIVNFLRECGNQKEYGYLDKTPWSVRVLDGVLANLVEDTDCHLNDKLRSTLVGSAFQFPDEINELVDSVIEGLTGVMSDDPDRCIERVMEVLCGAENEPAKIYTVTATNRGPDGDGGFYQTYQVVAYGMDQAARLAVTAATELAGDDEVGCTSYSASDSDVECLGIAETTVVSAEFIESGANG